MTNKSKNINRKSKSLTILTEFKEFNSKTNRKHIPIEGIERIKISKNNINDTKDALNKHDKIDEPITFKKHSKNLIEQQNKTDSDDIEALKLVVKKEHRSRIL